MGEPGRWLSHAAYEACNEVSCTCSAVVLHAYTSTTLDACTRCARSSGCVTGCRTWSLLKSGLLT
jgi:hypothetical protein